MRIAPQPHVLCPLLVVAGPSGSRFSSIGACSNQARTDVSVRSISLATSLEASTRSLQAQGGTRGSLR